MEEDRYWGRLVWDLLQSGQKHGQEQLLTGRRIRFHQYHIGEDILRRGSMGGETVHHSFGAFLVPTRDDYVDAHQDTLSLPAASAASRMCWSIRRPDSSQVGVHAVKPQEHSRRRG